jgi:SAM-dependent methyltransferase
MGASLPHIPNRKDKNFMAGPSGKEESQDDFRIFDRGLLKKRRDRAAAGFAAFDFLAAHVADGLADRLRDVNRRFTLAADLGTHAGGLAERIRATADHVVRTDLGAAFLKGQPGLRVVADEELLPFADGAFDLITSCLSLHWVNDLPGALVQVRRALKPDGLFLAAMLGGQTLRELRDSLAAAEAEVTGGLSPRVSPFADVRDVGDLLARAGFAMPVGDSEVVTVTYENLFRLMRDLRGMGETNLLLKRRRQPPPRALFLRAAEIYADRHGLADGRIPATFEVVYLTGWAPSPDQPKPKRPGSATHRLADALGAAEHQVKGTKGA